MNIKNLTLKRLNRKLETAIIISLFSSLILTSDSPAHAFDFKEIDNPLIQVFLLISFLSFLTAVLIMLTSFTRIVVVLSFLRHAFGRQDIPPSPVIIGKLPVFTLDPMLEKYMYLKEDGAISPDVINKLVKSIEKVLASGKFKGTQPIILCSSGVRKYLRRVVERISSSISVLSSSEIVSTTNLDVRGMLKYEG